MSDLLQNHLRDAAARRVTVDSWRRSSRFVDEGLPVIVGTDSVVFVRPSRSGKKARSVVVVAIDDLLRIEVTDTASTLTLDDALVPLLVGGPLLDTVRAVAGSDEVVALELGGDVIVVTRIVDADDSFVAVEVWGPRTSPRRRDAVIRLDEIVAVELRSRYARKLLSWYAR